MPSNCAPFPPLPESAGRQTPASMELVVGRVVQAARRIRTYELLHPDGAPLPPFTAGAHVGVETPSGESRHYSICSDPQERHRYTIAVQREDGGRGGSISLYDRIREGDRLRIGAPQNNFPLAPEARQHLLIAGGIGITPILAMVRVLLRRGAAFRLYYCSRSPEDAAFLDLLAQEVPAGQLVVHHDRGDPARVLDLGALLRKRAEGEHVYCCGPTPMLRAVRDAAAHWPRGSVHFEDFGTDRGAEEAGDRPFLVTIEDTGETFEVPPGRSILDTLRDQGYDVPSSCESGTCGTCMMRLLDGACDHRDFVLDEAERSRFLMVCVSRALGKSITIGL